MATQAVQHGTEGGRAPLGKGDPVQSASNLLRWLNWMDGSLSKSRRALRGPKQSVVLWEIGLSVPAKPKRTTAGARKAGAEHAEKATHEQIDHVLTLSDSPHAEKIARKKQLTSMPTGVKRR